MGEQIGGDGGGVNFTNFQYDDDTDSISSVTVNLTAGSKSWSGTKTPAPPEGNPNIRQAIFSPADFAPQAKKQHGSHDGILRCLNCVRYHLLQRIAGIKRCVQPRPSFQHSHTVGAHVCDGQVFRLI